ncbi:copper ion binding [Raphanus sativus]|nr:copper ion binding [Raphanus sativus]
MATTTRRTFCFVLVMVLMGCCCSAKIYKVGDSKGWRAKEGTYYEWAKRKEFQVGDSLMFEYDGHVNDVTQVSSRLEYQFCNSLSPKAVYNTGHDVVTLTEPGYHFFISSNHSQCLAGQKLVVFVVHDHPIPPRHRERCFLSEKITRSVTPTNVGFPKKI